MKKFLNKKRSGHTAPFFYKPMSYKLYKIIYEVLVPLLRKNLDKEGYYLN
jgi:hypothetical protein